MVNAVHRSIVQMVSFSDFFFFAPIIDFKYIRCYIVVDLDQDLDSISTTTTTTTTTSTTTSTTTAKPTSILSQSIQFSREGCEMDGFHYNDGDLIPSDPAKPCEICYCIQNRSMCTLQECRLEGVTGCEPIYQRNTCCPVKYDCCKLKTNSM